MKNKKNNPLPITHDVHLVDTHCHLDMRGYDDLDDVIASAVQAGVERIITVGIDLASSQKAVQIANHYPNVFATIGIHPHNASGLNEKTYDNLSSLFQRNNEYIVGFGEIGLDYMKKYSPREDQLREFTIQLQLAKDLNLPVIILDRDAHEDTLQLLARNKPYPAGGVMHCFSGDSDFARQVINLGFHISIPGIVTFKGSDILRQVVKDIPMDYLILETDGPFLAPDPFRGKTNRPEYLVYTANKVAEIKQIPLTEVALKTTVNAEKLFHLPAHFTDH